MPTLEFVFGETMPGRPKSPDSLKHRLQLRVSDDLYEAIQAISRDEGLELSEVVRTLILEGLEARREREE